MTTNEFIVALDPDGSSERSLPVVRHLANATGASIRLLAFVDAVHDAASARASLASALDRLDGAPAGIETSADVEVESHPAKALADRARPGAMLALATSGKRGLHDGHLGSIAEAVVRESAAPCLLVGPRCVWNEASTIERVMVPLDGSELSERAVPIAVDWGRALAVPIWVVTVLDAWDESFGDMPATRRAWAESNYVKDVVRSHAATGSLQWEVLHGAPSSALAVFADEATLTVMSTHGRSGISRAVLGSVTTSFVRQATGPVIAVHPVE